MNNNENAEYNNTLHFHVYNILCLHIIDNLTTLVSINLDNTLKQIKDKIFKYNSCFY